MICLGLTPFLQRQRWLQHFINPVCILEGARGNLLQENKGSSRMKVRAAALAGATPPRERRRSGNQQAPNLNSNEI